MRLSLVGMAGSGKSYWSLKLAAHGFRRFCCDELIAVKLAPELTRPDGTTIKTGEWVGFPYEPHHRERESKYLAYETQVLTEIVSYLERPEGHPEQNIVVDTTGSVIYAEEERLRSLGRHTTIVYLSTPPELRDPLLQAYVTNPHPMVWRELFSKRPDETNEQALARCYPRLVSARERLYERYAHVTIDYDTRSAGGFGVSEFLSATTVREA
jgi:shikimate kinase